MRVLKLSAIGVDELLWHKGQQYITVVYQIDAHCRRLLWVGKERDKGDLERLLHHVW